MFTFRRFLSGALALGVVCTPAFAVVFGQLDTFSDATTMGWREGTGSPNPPGNQPTGGPAGDGDRWLRNASSGGGAAGSRQVMLNQVQWTGNYTAAGVSRIEFDAANFGQNPIYLRVAVNGSFGTSWWATNQSILLPAGSGWRPVSFDLLRTEMTDLSGQIATFDQLMADVNEVRILSAREFPTFIGDRINAVLGVDNIRAAAVPEPTTLAALPALALLRRRR